MLHEEKFQEGMPEEDFKVGNVQAGRMVEGMPEEDFKVGNVQDRGRVVEGMPE